MHDILQRIDAFPESLAPLRNAARRYLQYSSALSESSVLKIGHRPWVAELNYMLTIYPGIDVNALDRYCRRFELSVPELYIEFLRAVNGVFCFGMSLCGVPGSTLHAPPLLDRSSLQCHDLATAAIHWVREYRVPAGWFHFGGRHFSYCENAGYFIADNHRIIAVRGKQTIIGEWASITDFMSDELKSSELLEEELHPAQWDARR